MHMTTVHTATREAVAAEVRAAAVRLRVSGRQIAATLGISQQALSRRMTGELAFDTDELAVVAELLGVEPRDFFPPAGAMPLQATSATVRHIASPQGVRKAGTRRNSVYNSAPLGIVAA